jgi:hypothetical protein
MSSRLEAVLSGALERQGVTAGANLDTFSSQLIAKAVDPTQSVDDIVALAKKAGLSAKELDQVLQQVSTGAGDFAASNMTTRGRLAKVMSKVIEGMPAAKVEGGITLAPGVTKDSLSAVDRKYIDAFEKAGITTSLTGEPGTLDAASFQRMLDISAKTKGLSVREFLVSVVVDSPDLHFAGATGRAEDNAAALIIAAAQRERTPAAAKGDDDTANKLETLERALTTSSRRGKQEIATIYRGIDAIHAKDPSAASPALRKTLGELPPTLKGAYELHLSHDGSRLFADPFIAPEPMARSATARGVVSERSAVGGRVLSLVDDTFAKGTWQKKSLEEIAGTDQRILDVMQQYKFDAKMTRDVLVVQGKDDPHPIYLIFSKSGDGVLSICKDAAFHDFASGGSGMIQVRKPVIYLYPTKKERVRVDLSVDGTFTARYPAMNRASGWEVLAEPEGMLVDAKTERRYPYLFWEAVKSAPFEIDPARSYLVSREQAADFLDRVAAAHALNDRERTDFASYWLATLEQNGLSMVQLLDADTYGAYAGMSIEPRPDTVIRLFMLITRATGEEHAGNPSLPQLTRRGFTVVEWGGTNLDERIDAVK